MQTASKTCMFFMQRLLLIVVMGWCWVLAPSAQAALSTTRVDVFTVVTSVEDKEMKSRKAAVREGMKKVLVRLSGDARVLSNYPALVPSVADAMQYLVSYRYENTLELKVELRYQQDMLMRLLRSVGAPVWQLERPPLLVLLVSDGVSGKRWLTTDDANDLYAHLSKVAIARGVPIELGTDILGLSKHDVWTMNLPEVRRSVAALRPGSAVLVGRLATSSDNKYIGEWAYLFSDKRLTNSYSGRSGDEYFSLGMNMAADSMAQDYSVISDATGSSERVLLRITGIQSQADHAQVVSYLRGLSTLQDLRLIVTERDTLLFDFESTSDMEKVQSLINLHRRFQRRSLNDGEWANSTSNNNLYNTLHYTWAPKS